MKKFSVTMATGLMVFAMSITGCGGSSQEVSDVSESASDGYTEVTIDNFDMEQTFTKAPERVVSLSYSETEILTALGLADRIVGIAEADNTIDVVDEKYRAEVEKLNVIAPNEDGGVPTLEVVMSQEPDFVYGTSYSFNSKFGVGDTQDFLDNNIAVYASSSTYKDDATIDDTYQDILNIGAIFGVQDRAEKLVADMKSRVDEIEEAVSAEEPATVLLYDSGEDSPYVYFENSYEGELAKIAGAKNIISAQEGGSDVISWETVIEANPEYIVINDWGGGEGAATISEKIAFLTSRPELAEVTAIKENNFITVPLEKVCFGALENPDAIETIAKALHPACFE